MNRPLAVVRATTESAGLVSELATTRTLPTGRPPGPVNRPVIVPNSACVAEAGTGDAARMVVRMTMARRRGVFAVDVGMDELPRWSKALIPSAARPYSARRPTG